MSRPRKAGGHKPMFKLDDVQRRRFLDILSRGASVRAACRMADLAYPNVMRWNDRARADRAAGVTSEYTEWLDQVEDARELALELLDDLEWSIAMDEDQPGGARLRAAEMVRNRILRRAPAIQVQVSGTVEHEHTGTVVHTAPTVPVQDPELRQLDTAALEHLATEIARVTGRAQEPVGDA